MDLTHDHSTFDWTISLPTQRAHPSSLHEGHGAVCETQRFDTFYNDSGDRVVLPAGQKYTAPKGQAYRSALAVLTYWSPVQGIEKTVLEIRSPHMKAALKAVVPEYSSFNIEVRDISIQNDPHCLFHYRRELLSYGAVLQEQGYDSEAPRHIQHLISYMWDFFKAEICAFSMCESLDYSLESQYLWMVFRPGDFVYVRKPHPRAFQFEKMERFLDSWTIRGYCIAYDGVSFGFCPTEASISRYDDVKPLRELEVVNFDQIPAGEEHVAKRQLVERGRKFIGIHGQRYLWYDGRLTRSTGCKTTTRIMADCEGYISHGLGHSCTFIGGKKTFSVTNALVEMTETDLMICVGLVAGYSLEDNKWDLFDIDLISDVEFDRRAFDFLVLPETQKQQILSLVRVHGDNRFDFDDLIKGKGRGTVCLLYGETGVGKTLTVESIAEYFQKPLLRLEAGSLGSSSHSVEIGLKSAFKLAERWNALLLLDEADVYLEQEKFKSLKHNSIVSAFCRTLKYFHGILFLTTNRIHSFDPALASCIDLAIHYRPLTPRGRRELLLTFLEQTSAESATTLRQQGVLDKLAEEQLNGRQIKNLVRTATALALSSDSPGCHIAHEHLMMALQPAKQFSQAIEEEIFHQDDLEEEGSGKVHGVNEVGRNNESESYADELQLGKSKRRRFV